MESIRFQQNLTSSKAKSPQFTKQAQFSGQSNCFPIHRLQASPSEQLENLVALSDESFAFISQSKDPLNKRLNQLSKKVLSLAAFIEGNIIKPLQKFRVGQINQTKQNKMLKAIKAGASPSTPISYEKLPYTTATEPFLHYAMGGGNTPIVRAFFETSPEASHDLMNAQGMSNLLGFGYTEQLKSPDDPMALLILKEVGVEKLSQFKELNANPYEQNSKGSFLFHSIQKLHPAFVNAFTDAGKHIEEPEIAQSLSLVKNQFTDAPSYMNGGNPLKEKYAMVSEEMAIGTQVLHLLETAINPADESLLNNFKTQQKALIKLRDEIWDTTVPKDQREHGPFFRTPLI